MNTDALSVLGILRVICSARRPLAWPQRFSETHPILRHERIRSMLSTSVRKVLLFPSTFCCAGMSFGPAEVGEYSSRVAVVSACAL